MKREIPTDSEGRRLCEFCMETPVPASLGTKPKRYCSRNCRQRAYEARRQAKVIRSAVNNAVGLDRRYRPGPDSGTSRDVPAARPATSRDVPGQEELPLASPENPQAGAPATSRDVPGDPGQGWVRSPDAVDAQLRALETRRSRSTDS